LLFETGGLEVGIVIGRVAFFVSGKILQTILNSTNALCLTHGALFFPEARHAIEFAKVASGLIFLPSQLLTHLWLIGRKQGKEKKRYYIPG
jgi:hypothetical protein